MMKYRKLVEAAKAVDEANEIVGGSNRAILWLPIGLYKEDVNLFLSRCECEPVNEVYEAYEAYYDAEYKEPAGYMIIKTDKGYIPCETQTITSLTYL